MMSPSSKSPWTEVTPTGSRLTAVSPHKALRAAAFTVTVPFANPLLCAIHFFTLDTPPGAGTNSVHTVPGTSL